MTGVHHRVVATYMLTLLVKSSILEFLEDHITGSLLIHLSRRKLQVSDIDSTYAIITDRILLWRDTILFNPRSTSLLILLERSIGYRRFHSWHQSSLYR